MCIGVITISEGMAPNPIVVAKANELYPHLHFNFMTWLKGSCIPALVCAAFLPLLLAWSCGVFKSTSDINQAEQEGAQTKLIGDDIVEHAKKELSGMGSMSVKEWVYFRYKLYVTFLLTLHTV